RRILNLILSNTREDLESRYRLITERYTPLMKFLEDLGAPLPQALQAAADIVLSAQIIREFQAEQIDVERLRHQIDEARARNVNAFNSDLAYAVKRAMERLMQSLAAAPEDLEVLKKLEE